MKTIKPSLLLSTMMVILSLVGCKNDSKKVTNVVENNVNKEKIEPPKKILIKGVSDDKAAFEYLNFMDYSKFVGGEHNDFTELTIGDSVQLTFETIKQPQILELFAFGSEKMQNTRMLMSPGDTVIFSIHDNKLLFKGAKAAHYNFFAQLDPENHEYAKNRFNGDIQLYKEKTKVIYKRRRQFFDDYIRKKEVSSSFVKLVGAELKFEYFYNLIAPRSSSISTQINANNPKDFINTITLNQDPEKDDLFDLSAYVDDVQLKEFNHPELLNNDYFKRALIGFIRNYFTVSDGMNYTAGKFLAEIKFIQKNLTGDLKSFAIARTIFDYDKNGFGHSVENVKVLKETINEVYPSLKNKPSFLEMLDMVRAKIEFYKFKLSESDYQTKLLTVKGDTVTLRDVFNLFPNKINILDFWATWCAPCLSEIKNDKRFRDQHNIENNVNWIYLSVDKTKAKWKAGLKNLSAYLQSENQFYILKKFGTARLIKTLHVESIPRYVIFDENERIIIEAAPRPSDSIAFNRIIDKINGRE